MQKKAIIHRQKEWGFALFVLKLSAKNQAKEI
jgi:hypothetical protein